MTAILLDDSAYQYLERVNLSAGMDEKWLQELLFAHPMLLPLERVEPGAGSVVPICRELSLPGRGACVFLDLLGVTRHGRLVLVECKLWRNPQARREVVAQILEYAALLQRWTYADLTAHLRARLGFAGKNPLFEHVRSRFNELDEVAFTDAVARNLRSGDFHLMIAGDGIREDIRAIAEHLAGRGSRLCLVEFQIWQDASGKRVVIPQVPLRTEVVRQRIVTDASGAAVRIEDDEGASEEAFEQDVDPEKAAIRQANRAFWQRFIDGARFDHPDQPQPRHGGNNWVKIPMPSPGRWITVYRYKDQIGFSIVAEDAEEVVRALAVEADLIRQETGLPDLRFHRFGAPSVEDTVGLNRSQDNFASEEAQIAWCIDVANRLVSALRPRLSHLSLERGTAPR
jgi:hypothetical protein